jgi:hypothetical protein
MSTFDKLLRQPLLILVFSFSFSAFAQQRISGTVINSANKLPLLGASVHVKGADRTVQTGADGKFSIDASG